MIRLDKLLLLLSHARRHRGVTVPELANAVGMSDDEVRGALDDLSLCGRPPFQPDDLIDVYVDERGRVQLVLDQSLGRPLRFTREESLALSVALDTVGGAAAGHYSEIARALRERLARAAALDANGQDAALRIETAAPALEATFRVLASGLEERREVEIEYYTQSREALTRRHLQPYGLLQLAGYWYVMGHDDLRGEQRVFRLDRIREARLTEQRFVQPAHFDLRQLSGLLAGPHERARVRFSPSAAPALCDQWPASQLAQQPDGSVILTLDCYDPGWLASWVLSFGDRAELLEPEAARAALAERGRRTLDLYT